MSRRGLAAAGRKARLGDAHRPVEGRTGLCGGHRAVAMSSVDCWRRCRLSRCGRRGKSNCFIAHRQGEQHQTAKSGRDGPDRQGLGDPGPHERPFQSNRARSTAWSRRTKVPQHRMAGTRAYFLGASQRRFAWGRSRPCRIGTMNPFGRKKGLATQSGYTVLETRMVRHWGFDGANHRMSRIEPAGARSIASSEMLVWALPYVRASPARLFTTFVLRYPERHGLRSVDVS